MRGTAAEGTGGGRDGTPRALCDGVRRRCEALFVRSHGGAAARAEGGTDCGGGRESGMLAARGKDRQTETDMTWSVLDGV